MRTLLLYSGISVLILFVGLILGIARMLFVPILSAGQSMLVHIDDGPPSLVRCSMDGLHRNMFIKMNGAPLYADIRIGHYLSGRRNDFKTPVIVLCPAIG